MRAVTAAAAWLAIALLVGMPAAMAEPVLDGTLDGSDQDVDSDDYIVGEEMCALPERPGPGTFTRLDFPRLR